MDTGFEVGVSWLGLKRAEKLSRLEVCGTELIAGESFGIVEKSG